MMNVDLDDFNKYMIFASKSTLVFSGETGIPDLLQRCYHFWGEKNIFFLNRPHFFISVSALGLLSTCKAHVGTKYKCVNWSNEKVTISGKLNYNNNNDLNAVEDKKEKFKYQKTRNLLSICLTHYLPIMFMWETACYASLLQRVRPLICPD